ncbi:MarR family transcriptional regulator [Novosphingobium sp. G106]|uniref:MarR family transcriptional regulator n=1 Tax=Novosphingobium sp. G106 TaxID=2849500 RepID=UPI001C2CF068|nr:helix-turn-helix domain-containing protein [Novosphingobium sp. G106]MBV1691229.1 MarR family transcriptional regulator [Novosphingobium sp. G106]
MARVGGIFGKAAKALGFSVLTPEYEIILALVDAPSLTVDQLHERSSLSRAGFFNTIERLKSLELIISVSDVIDRRRRSYMLSDDLRDIIFYRFRKYRVDYSHHEGDKNRGQDFITRELTARRERGLDYFTCEFRILFYLYLNSDLPNHALRGLVDASDTKFHNSLKVLLENDLISVSSESSDKRIKLYNVGCLVRLVMQQLHADIFSWLDVRDAACAQPDHPPPMECVERLAASKGDRPRSGA